MKPSLGEHGLDRLTGKPPQMRAVKQTIIGLWPLAGHQIAEHRPVLSVRDASQNLGAWGQKTNQSLEMRERVGQMLKDVPQNQNVGLVFKERPIVKKAYFDRAIKRECKPRFRDFACLFVTLDSEPLNPGIHSPISLTQSPGPAPNLKHSLRVGRNKLKQLRVVIVEVSRNRHGSSPLRLTRHVLIAGRSDCGGQSGRSRQYTRKAAA